MGGAQHTDEADKTVSLAGPDGIEHLEDYAIKYVIKILLGTMVLLCLLVLAGFLPGASGYLPHYPVTFIVYAMATVLLIGAVFTGAGAVVSLVREPFSSTILGVVRAVVTMLAIVIAYFGIGSAVQLLFVESGTGILYPLVFVVIGLVPLGLIALHGIASLRTYERKPSQNEAADERGGSESGESTPSESGELPLLESGRPSDESRILGLLEENSGRARQSGLTEATGWSKSKVSRLLSRMEEDELVTRYRLGREKIVCLPGNEIDIGDSSGDTRSETRNE